MLPIENMMRYALKSAGFDFCREYIIMRGRKVKYRLDFALLRKNGKLDIECDGYSWHSTPAQRAKDGKRDKWLKRRGWTILRFGEQEVVNNLECCIEKISRAVKSCE